MEKSLFRYIWRHSRRDQLAICAVVLLSLPFYFAALDLPRRIINEAIQGRAFEDGRARTMFFTMAVHWPDWLGGGVTRLLPGLEVDRLGLLFGLSGLYLALVLVNGAFKYWINVAKGALGERLLRRLRFDLFALILRFTPQALRGVKAAETATIVKDEVEPIGAFSGDAFVLPAFLGSQAATALAFILVQNLWLGLMAAGVVGVQVLLIPRLRRELLRLSKRRQLASRQLAGRVGEIIEGMEAVRVHGVERWERAEIGHRLFELFELRFHIFKRKFLVKFLNNLLAQITPFLFYAVGGYLALKGELDIGQLVAVIAAYRELPPPLKELIDWDQQRLDVQVKYDQVAQHFAPDRLLPSEPEPADAQEAALSGPLVIEHLTVLDALGRPVIDDLSLVCPLPARIALVSDGGGRAEALARVLARRNLDYQGRVRIGEADLFSLPGGLASRRIAYAGAEPILFPGSIRDNLVYGLRRQPLTAADAGSAAERRRIMEARRTGNPVESIGDEWVDPWIAGASGARDLDEELVGLLKRLGMEEDIYRFGLSEQVDPRRHPDVAARLIEARTRLRAKLAADGVSGLVEPFDPAAYNLHATVAENLLFGVPRSPRLVGRTLVEQHELWVALARTGLTRQFVAMGLRIAEATIEMFRGLPSNHPLFEQFSLISADELPECERMLGRHARRKRFSRADARRLMALPLAYIEPRHRLGLVNERMAVRLLAARERMRGLLNRARSPEVEFYDPGKVCVGASFRDNLLFGRINLSVTDAQEQVRRRVIDVITDMGMRRDIERIGLDYQVGPAGRLLSAPQRTSIDLARCLIRRPTLLVLGGWPAEAARRVVDLFGLPEPCTLIAVLPNDAAISGFDVVIRFQGPTASVARTTTTGSGGDRSGTRQDHTAALTE